MEQQLFLSLTGVVIGVITVLVGVLLSYRGGCVRDNVKKPLFLLFVAVALSLISYSFGVVMGDESVAYILLSTAFLGMFVAVPVVVLHTVVERFHSDVPAARSTMGVMYVIACALIIGFILLTPGSIISVEPFMSFPYFIQAGRYFWIFVIFLCLASVLSLVLLAVRYISAVHKAEHNTINKLQYYLIGLFFLQLGLIAGDIPSYLGAPLGFSLSPFFGLFLIPILYVELHQHVRPVTNVLRYSVVYIAVVVGVTLAVRAVTFVNDWLLSNIDGFSEWIVPALFSLAVVTAGGVVWFKVRQIDILKYEFITIITHKFRTPLTRIKWSVDLLRTAESEEERRSSEKEIKQSAQKLVDLTDMLVDLNKMSGMSYQYKFVLANLNNIVSEVYASYKKKMEEKDIKYVFDPENTYTKVVVDKERLSFVLQILFENATTYTPHGGTVKVRTEEDNDNVIFSITDSGIGISEDEVANIFSKFYRTPRAKLVDTEGMGIGLFMSKGVIDRHGGKMWVTSPGPNKGTTFSISLPKG